MWKEVLQDFKYNRFLYRSARVNLGSILIGAYGFFFIVLASFLQLHVYSISALPVLLQGNFDNLTYTLYSPQIPTVIFCVFLLGRHVGFLTILSYITCGLLGFPVWASKAGINIIDSPAFGFILGFVITTFIINNLCFKNITSVKLVFSAIVSVLFVHLFGVTYMLGLMFFEKVPFESIFYWIHTLSLSTLTYDIVFSVVAISLVRPIKSILWIVMD